MPIIHDEEFRTWESTVRQGQRGDPVWRFHAYRVALFMLDRVGRDAVVLKRQSALPFQTDQPLRAVASIGANIAADLTVTVVDQRFEQLTELRKLLIGAQKWLESKPRPTRLM